MYLYDYNSLTWTNKLIVSSCERFMKSPAKEELEQRWRFFNIYLSELPQCLPAFLRVGASLRDELIPGAELRG